MKKKVYFLIVLFLFIFPNNVEASCTSLEKARLKKMVSNVNISYDYEMVSGKAIFSIKFNNLSPEFYFTDPYKNSYRIYNMEDNEIVLKGYADGKSYSFNFFGISSCGSQKIATLYATTPTYNPYYKLGVCDNAKEYELCQKWVSHSLNRVEFIEKVKEYKNSKGIIDESEVHKEISIMDFAMSFIRMYGVYVAIGIAVIIFIIKFIRYKKDTFGF